MTIKRFEYSNSIEFGDLTKGDVFEYCTTIHMKIVPVMDEEIIVGNAIELKSGILRTLATNSKVVAHKDATLILCPKN